MSILSTKKAQPTAAQNSFLPPENIWFLLRKTQEKRAQMRSNFPKSSFLVEFYNSARTYFEEKCWKHKAQTECAPPAQTFAYFLDFPRRISFWIWKKSGRALRRRRAADYLLQPYDE